VKKYFLLLFITLLCCVSSNADAEYTFITDDLLTIVIGNQAFNSDTLYETELVQNALDNLEDPDNIIYHLEGWTDGEFVYLFTDEIVTNPLDFTDITYHYYDKYFDIGELKNRVFTNLYHLLPDYGLGNSIRKPAKLGEEVYHIVYKQFLNQQQINMTMLESYRGSIAKDLVTANNNSITLPEGYEFLVVKFQVELLSYKNGSCYIDPMHFQAYSPEGEEYEWYDIDLGNNLMVTFDEGETVKGYVGFVVPKDEPNPLVVYGTISYSEIRDGAWFQIEPEDLFVLR
jgi:hypothetical protein